jgi:hypothetical protein
MSLEFLLMLFYFWLLLLGACMICLALTLIIHFLVPKSLLETYFKEPYFARWEIVTFSSFPFGYMRTLMFMRLAGFPNSGKKRGLTEAYKLTPNWFRLASKIVVSAFIGFCAPMFLLGIILFPTIYVLYGRG